MTFSKFFSRRAQVVRRRSNRPQLLVEILEGRQLPSTLGGPPVAQATASPALSQVRNFTQPLVPEISLPSLDATTKDPAAATFKCYTETLDFVPQKAQAITAVKTGQIGVADFTNPTQLQNNVPMSNIDGARGSQRYFRITVPPGLSEFSVQVFGGSGDVDLYLKRGGPPTRSNWDYRPYRNGNNETVVVRDPAPGDWHIMLDGYAAYSGVTLGVCFR